MKSFGSLIAGVIMCSGGILQAGELAKPYQLLAGDQPIDIGGIGYAAPFVGDFNMDGRRDLLVGQFKEGKMRIFLNEGTNESPQFGKDYVWFQNGADTGRVPTG
jgi:hypothetical protein